MALLADIMEEASRIEDDKLRGEYIRMEIRTLESTIKLLTMAADELGDSKTPGEFTGQEENFMRAGAKIKAIQHVRSRTGCGLTPARRAVEDWMNAQSCAEPLPTLGCATAVEDPKSDFRDYMP